MENLGLGRARGTLPARSLCCIPATLLVPALCGLPSNVLTRILGASKVIAFLLDVNLLSSSLEPPLAPVSRLRREGMAAGNAGLLKHDN